MKNSSIFKYNLKKSYLHKVPAIIKLLLLLPISIFCVTLSPIQLCVLIITVIIIALSCKITVIEQITDLKPAIYYASLMYILSIISNLIIFLNTETFTVPVNFWFNSSTLFFFIPAPDFIKIPLRLFLLVQLSALVFRTTSQLEIREAVRIEAIFLFLSFIPDIFKTWTQINLAWNARGGKPGMEKIKTLVFVLISLNLEKASIKAKAIEARRNNDIK